MKTSLLLSLCFVSFLAVTQALPPDFYRAYADELKKRAGNGDEIGTATGDEGNGARDLEGLDLEERDEERDLDDYLEERDVRGILRDKFKDAKSTMKEELKKLKENPAFKKGWKNLKKGAKALSPMALKAFIQSQLEESGEETDLEDYVEERDASEEEERLLNKFKNKADPIKKKAKEALKKFKPALKKGAKKVGKKLQKWGKSERAVNDGEGMENEEIERYLRGIPDLVVDKVIEKVKPILLKKGKKKAKEVAGKIGEKLQKLANSRREVNYRPYGTLI